MFKQIVREQWFQQGGIEDAISQKIIQYRGHGVELTRYRQQAELRLCQKNGSSVGRAKASQFVSVPSDISIPELVNGVKIYDYNMQKNMFRI